MAANTAPIFTNVPNIGFGATVLDTANTAKDGTGTVLLVFTAGANGSLLLAVRARPIGTNVATVLRVFFNNGADPTTASNNVLHDEMTLPATTLSEVAALAMYEMSINKALPANWRVYVTIGTTVAAGFRMSAYGGNY